LKMALGTKARCGIEAWDGSNRGGVATRSTTMGSGTGTGSDEDDADVDKELARSIVRFSSVASTAPQGKGAGDERHVRTRRSDDATAATSAHARVASSSSIGKKMCND